METIQRDKWWGGEAGGSSMIPPPKKADWQAPSWDTNIPMSMSYLRGQCCFGDMRGTKCKVGRWWAWTGAA